MKKKINISKNILLRLAVLFFIFGGAFVFDVCQDNSTISLDDCQESTTSHNLSVNHIYFFNPASSFKLFNKEDKQISRILFSTTQNKFLSRYHNHRAFHTFKEGSVSNRMPYLLMAHFMKFTSVQYSSPDDDPSHC